MREQEVTLPIPNMQERSTTERRLVVQQASVAVVYRHVCADAAAAASGQDWAECGRLMQIARSIERTYPEATAKARFSTHG